MTHDTSLSAIGRQSSVLDRSSLSQSAPPSEVQALTDNLTSTFLEEATNLRTAAAMLGAGWVGRATRIGALGALPGQALLPQVVRAASFVPALAAESAAFAGIERGFHSLQGHSSSRPFHQDWARAAVTLGGLKAFSALGAGQNLIFQHLTTDLGLVGSQHLAGAVGLTPRPTGSLAQQMLMAEATNWQMMGSLALAHGLSPRLSAAETGLDLYLRSQETSLPTLNPGASMTPALATAGAASSSPAVTRESPAADPRALTVFSMGSRDHDLPGSEMSRFPEGGDPMSGRGTYISSSLPLGGGGRGPKGEISAGDLSGVFPGDGPPPDGSRVLELVKHFDLVEPLSQGKLFTTLDRDSGSIPTTYGLVYLPANHTQVFSTLMKVNEMAKWMPRLEWFQVVGNHGVDARSIDRGRPVELNVDGRFKAGSMMTRPLIFQGRFIFNFRHLPEGAQMSWRLKDGDQSFPEHKDAKAMSVNNSSFTLVPAPGRSDRTICAYNIRVEPESSLLRGFMHSFLPGAHLKELDRFFFALANRSVSSNWTGKDKDPAGIEIFGVANPSKMNYELVQLIP